MEARSSRYSIHSGATKMYHDLWEVYWWNVMKKNIVELVAKYPNCQQVMVEHHKPEDSDVILGVDLLSPYHVVLDFNIKMVSLVTPRVSRSELKSASGHYVSKVISFLHTQRLVDKWCVSYLAFFHDTSVELPLMESIHMLQEYTDAFPTDLLCVPPDRDIDFAIDLESYTKLISIPPYHMAQWS
ncbi:hypothetical protein MTR67_018362 [Solanum verrucosum]|uniref:Integrase zinc-binding domain-containing protein n=1 Tax=Solanum verrucosum TaxID=315347 RepID=A0AAF0QLK7_SOLVR|nr:hypothetical protein MTR67_018362 [Solanum verrucosum]